MSKGLKINVGSGPQRYDGWQNVDIDPSVGPDYICDVANLPFNDGSVDAVFASHVLEHMPFGEDVVVEWKRVLKPGGILIVAVPDLQQLMAMFHVGAIDLKYLHATVYGSQMYGHPAATMTHHRIYTPVILAQEIGRHFPEISIGGGPVSPRNMLPGEVMIHARK